MESLTQFSPQVKQPRMERYFYPSFGHKELDAVCGVSIYQHNGQTICIVPELPKNHGTSITNRTEYVYRQIAQDYGLDAHATIFIIAKLPLEQREVKAAGQVNDLVESGNPTPLGLGSSPSTITRCSARMRTATAGWLVRELIGVAPPEACS